MLFASTLLAARIERAECRLSVDVAAVLARKGQAAFAHPVSGGAAVFAGVQSPFNKLIGVGFDGPLDVAALAEAERRFFDQGAAIRAEVSTLADPSVVTTLSRRGYALVGFEDVLGCPLVETDTWPEHPPIAIAEVSQVEWPLYLDTVVTGFMTPDTQGVPGTESYSRELLEPLFDHMREAPGYHHHLARMDGRVVGGGTSRIDEGMAQMCGAATLPAFRRRGVQSALLAARLQAAAALGCDLAVVTTLPGSKSQENVMRRGFVKLSTRAVLVLEPPSGP